MVFPDERVLNRLELAEQVAEVSVCREEYSRVRFETQQLKRQVSFDHQREVHVPEDRDDLQLLALLLSMDFDFALVGYELKKLLLHLSQQDSLVLIVHHELESLDG